MGLLSRIFGRKNQQATTQAEMMEAQVCPNCWGKQEYAGQERQYLDGQTSAYMRNSKKAFIQEFVQNNITGIPKGKIKYRYMPG